MLFPQFTHAWFKIMILAEVPDIVRGISKIDQTIFSLCHPRDTNPFSSKKFQYLYI